MQQGNQSSHSAVDAVGALRVLDSGVDRETWVRVLTAAKAAGVSLEEAIDWSSRAANFDGVSTVKAVWKSIKADGGIGPGTLYCRRRFKSDPPRRSNIDPGMDADRVMVGCGQV